MTTGRGRASGQRRATPLGSAVAALLAALAIVAGLTSCGGDDDPGPQPPERFFPLDLAGFTEVRNCRPSVEHFPNVRVLIDSAAATAYVDSIYPFVEGTVCVKIVYNDDFCAQILEYNVMRKGPPGTAPASGDWEWQVANANGEVTASGQLAECISCHTDCTFGRDFMCTDP